jgi:hypothetical protein
LVNLSLEPTKKTEKTTAKNINHGDSRESGEDFNHRLTQDFHEKNYTTEDTEDTEN